MASGSNGLFILWCQTAEDVAETRITAEASKSDGEITAPVLAARCGETYDTVNHWARMGLLPYKKRGNARLISTADSEKHCRQIRELQNEDCNLPAIRRMLANGELDRIFMREEFTTHLERAERNNMTAKGTPAISDETRTRIEEGLRNWSSADSDARVRFEAAQSKWDQALQPLEDAILASERLTEEDYSIRFQPLS
ncbi:MAG TPA: MerR family transcriptional regulator [Pirellulaceae bacterium]|nr:MerR family transcriptional regulator [Pirellulaceae bacterium]